VTDPTCGFKRARRPEQREARRQAILDAAAAMLAEQSVTEISLRELSRRVGLAKSNVLRYFESREAVFLELLDQAVREWLAQLPERFASHTKGDPAERVAAAMAASIAERPLLCELISVTAGVLERNISMEVARNFKLATSEAHGMLAGMVREQVPGLDEPGALHFAAVTLIVVAGLWPFANPTEQVLAAIEELELDVPQLVFEDMLRETLGNQLVGLLTARISVR
jgi:AcrR family transcriptional regulator